MTWEPLNFHGIATIDRAFVDQINKYLNENESELAGEILDAIHVSLIPAPSLEHPITGKYRITLTEALEIFRKKVEEKNHKDKAISLSDWHQAIDKINTALWNYVEVLEGSSTELFLQVSQLHFKELRFEVAWGVDAIKEVLRQHIETTKNAFKRLDSLLWIHHSQVAPSSWVRYFGNFFRFSGLFLDRSILKNLEEIKTFLLKEYQKFVAKYNGYQTLDAKTQEHLNKFDWYVAFNQLERPLKTEFKDIYHFLRLWELNGRIHVIPQQEIASHFRDSISIDRAVALFKDYERLLKQALFKTGRVIKIGLQEGNKTQESIQEEIAQYRSELHTLGYVILNFREFLLKSDPDPYISKRLGFTEWSVGPEPGKTKELLQQSFNVESLDRLYVQFIEEFKYALENPQNLLPNFLQQEVKEIIHEIAQPLNSFPRIRKFVERLLDLMEQSRELGTTLLLTVDFMEETFSKAMRADWKYQALHKNPRFHHLYDIHKNLLGLQGDRAHITRMQKFKHYFQKIESWVKAGSTQIHSHEIETEINDIKSYLQDFLAYLQRCEKDSTLSAERIRRLIIQAKFELVEYRYIFGTFFLHLQNFGSEGQRMRKQFLFVDQYFEYMENKINDIKLISREEKEEEIERRDDSSKDEG